MKARNENNTYKRTWAHGRRRKQAHTHTMSEFQYACYLYLSVMNAYMIYLLLLMTPIYWILLCPAILFLRFISFVWCTVHLCCYIHISDVCVYCLYRLIYYFSYLVVWPKYVSSVSLDAEATTEHLCVCCVRVLYCQWLLDCCDNTFIDIIVDAFSLTNGKEFSIIHINPTKRAGARLFVCALISAYWENLEQPRCCWWM